MTILVTGATGLVGARLLPRLVERGEACRALVRPGKSGPTGVTAVEGDLLDAASLADAVTGVSAIIHLAAVFRTQDSDLIWKSNLEGTRSLTTAAQAHAPQARFIMASTSNVYGRNSTRPARESDPVEPEQAYPASKVAAEKLLRETTLNWSIIRFPFVYGEGDGHLEMLPKLLHLFDFHPANRMSTIHHRDIATAMNMALKGVFDRCIVNISDDAPTTIYELVELVGGTMTPSSEAVRDPWFQHVDSSLARSLGFQPTVRSVHQAMHERIM